MYCFASGINYESATFWVTVTSLAVAVIVSVVSLYLSKVSVRIAENSLKLTKELAERDLRDWTQRKWFDLYDAAEIFRTLLERFQVKYDKQLATKDFEDDAHELVFAARRMIRFGCADSDEGNQYSGLIVISIPGWCDQSSERSDAGFCIL
ncbi:MAG: hypothetical protein WCE53_08695 [Candidatus Acidiferrum sp.]